SVNQEEEQTNNSLIRLTFDSPIGLHRQIVLGTDDNASTGFDIGYDAFMADVNQEDMFWLQEQQRFVIQGVDSFNDGQEFPIGLIIKENGLARIKIEDLENIEANIEIYIRDTETGEQYDIINESFEVHLEPGTYEEKYTIVFMRETIVELIPDEDVNVDHENFVVHYDSKPSELTIKSGPDKDILNVTLFNSIGQKIRTLDFSSSDTITLHMNTGVYILHIETSAGIINKKIIIN
ncbi:MAG: T9SS type A sorting domain-containing protein, partial [Flavobacteriaceae bacterium]|nr:T9SS type A sorting domain-containing protein [Flavobacteriaceae bacterium]